MIKRRYVLLGGVAAMAGFSVIRFAMSSEESSIQAVLKKCLSHLQLDAAGVLAFAKDFEARHILPSARVRLVGAIGPLYADIDSTKHNKLGDTVRHGEEHVVTKYLLSTDFFANGSDESKTVHYLGFYDPQRAACVNPFGRRVG